MQNYYVYCYLDTRKPGKFQYLNYVFDYLPIYIGKGKEDRCNKHLKDCYNKNIFFKRKIHKIIKETGDIPKIIKIKENLLESDAYSLEKILIDNIGRIDLNKGSLVNMTDGGEGLINCSEITKNKLRIPFTEERKKKISESKKGKPANNKTKELLLSYSKVPVVLLDSDLKVIKEFNTISEVCSLLNITNASVFRFCNYYYNMRDGKTIRYKKDLNGMKTYIKNEENDKKRKYLPNSRKKG